MSESDQNIQNIQNIHNLSNTSPLRYPGGKTRACKKLDEILNTNFNIENIKTIVSPFFGGVSFEFFLQNKYNLDIICNDKFKPLYNFWNSCKDNSKKEELCKLLYGIVNTESNNITKDKFLEYRNDIMKETDIFKQAFYYFIINRCSFSGATLSGGFSLEASKKRFTKSSIDRLKSLDLSKVQIYNKDFEEFLSDNVIHDTIDNTNTLIFLDPPYFLEKGSKLYGNKGDMHESFNHKKLFELLSSNTSHLHNKKWLMTYNNCNYIKDLYKNYIIIEVDWSYGMNPKKISSEIVIINNGLILK